jgi:uncharacterized membrane protein
VLSVDDGNVFGPGPKVGFEAARGRRYQRVLHALRRRRRLRLGLIQLIYVLGAVALATLMPALDFEPQVDNVRVTGLLFSLSGGLVAMIALIFSLLFLVVPYANTSLTPRLTLFRDSPIVWHTFSFFVATFVYLSVSGILLSNDHSVSWLVPTIALLVILAALGQVRALQFRAYRSLQLGATIMDITAQGENVMGFLYRDAIVDDPQDRVPLPPVVQEVRWPHGLCLLRQVDVPRLLKLAGEIGSILELRVGVGEELRHGTVLFAVHGGKPVDGRHVVRLVDVGSDRTFDQDPLFAFRLLTDIALRAVSAAVNDPITAVQAIGGVHALLASILDRDLDVGRIGDDDGTLRVVVAAPTWSDYLTIGVDELIPYLGRTPQARARIRQMLGSLLADAPPGRRASLEARLTTLDALATPALAPAQPG